MSMGASALAEALINLGACEGLDPKNCAQATMKMVSMGEKGKPFAAMIMGSEFDAFKRQWRTAFERLTAEESEAKSSVKKKSVLWKNVGVKIK
jgi:hypothetical protein